jgi:adenylate cyclase
LQLQYWRSQEQLVAYARSKNSEHLPAWAHFNKVIADTTAVGIWHETYVVRAGEYECVYGNMPPFGLARATERVEAVGRLRTAAGRLGKGDGGDSPV